MIANPWFWAFLAMLGWFLSLLVVGTRTCGDNLGFGIVCFILVELPRIILPLPFVVQTRFGGNSPFFTLAGAVILVVSLIFATPVFRIYPLTGPNRKEPLRINGLYGIVRHPVMFCDSFWPLGWSLIFGSLIGILLTPIWFGVSYYLTILEEERLVQEYGEDYIRYQRKVPRIIPFVRQL